MAEESTVLSTLSDARQQDFGFVRQMPAGSIQHQVATFLRLLANEVEGGLVRGFERVEWTGKRRYSCTVLFDGRYRHFEFAVRDDEPDMRQAQMFQRIEKGR